MAYASLLSLAQTLDQVLIRHNSYVNDHEKQQIQSLHEKIVFLSTFLEDFPREATKLEARITVAANQVEDIFELHILKKTKHSHNLFYDLIDIFFILGGLPPPRIYLKNLYEQFIKKEYFPTKEIDSILKEARKMKGRCTRSSTPLLNVVMNSVMEVVMKIKSSRTSENEMMSTPVLNVQGPVMGFEKDLLEIQERLHGVSAKLEVIPIVGMGGIGKTTLARYAFHHPLSLQNFDVCGWVTVSQNYDKATILLSLLNSIDASTKGNFQKESLQLQQRVYQYLKGRRFLIVVDDIWSGKTWDDLRRVFPDDFNWSRIIITTRDAHVASYIDSSSHPYEMHLMGVDSSWNLLRQRVFEEEQCPPELEEIGRQIAEKCRGLPLAIVVIAGVLSMVDLMQETWKKIAINVNEAVNTSDEPFAKILSLSYTWLPHHLRPCFLYMGGFPEDYEIHVSDLIRIWVAEGFLKSNGSKDLEEVAEDYLEDLAKRSLVMIIKKKRYNGRIKSIKMHDLLRDLCLRKAHDENFLNVIHKCCGSVLPIGKSRRISILSSVKNNLQEKDYSPTHTILAFDNTTFDCWKYCTLLRILDLMVEDMRLLDNQIGELFHLRYLAFTIKTNNPRGISKVLEYCSRLVNLQTLIIRGYLFSFKLYLPHKIWSMRDLRHVIVCDGFLPIPSPDISPLQNLHTLKRIRYFRCSKRILEFIPNLKKLGIIYSSKKLVTYLDRDSEETQWSKYSLNNLIHLQKLEKLNLEVDSHDYYFHSDLSERLAFPVTLKKLTLRGTGIPWEDMSIVGLLPNLQVLKLMVRACCGVVWETTEEQFCELKVLVVDSTDSDVWITESCHFPRLERLILRHCHKLKEIPCDIGNIATLQLIELRNCKSSVVESAKSIEEEQRDFGNDLFQLHLKGWS